MLESAALDIAPNPLAALAGSSLGEVAAALAALGFPVFPTHSIDARRRCNCGTNCGRNAGKHPLTSHGLHDATTCQSLIGEWWKTWPNANIAVVTGSSSGIWVLDIDPDTGGEETITALETEHGDLPQTWCVETGGDGLHLWFRLAHGPLRNSVGLLGPGLDVRADGGYVIVPPSQHRSGNRYRWAEAWHPALVELAPAPDWLVDLARHPASPKMIPPDASPKGETVGGNHSQPLPNKVVEGARNSTLTSLAGVMRRKGCGESAILTALLVENSARCQPPLPVSEVCTIAHSVSRYDPAPEPAKLVRGTRSGSFVEIVGGKAVTR